MRGSAADATLGAVAVELLVGSVHLAATWGATATARTTRVQAEPHQWCRYRTYGTSTPVSSPGQTRGDARPDRHVPGPRPRKGGGPRAPRYPRCVKPKGT